MSSLALTDQQLDIVMAVAEQIPHRWRSRYLEGVADYLFGIKQISNDDVAEAVRSVGARFHRVVEPAASPREALR